MKIVKTRQVNHPEIGEKDSAGYDFFVPVPSTSFKKSFTKWNGGKRLEKANNNEIIRIYPHEIVKIPTGIKVKMKRYKLLNFFFRIFGIRLIPKLQAYDKSSLGSTGLKSLAGLIDYSYRGEIIAVVTNLNTETTIDLKTDSKFIQFVQEFALVTSIKQIRDEDYNKAKSERGSGGFGSTNKK